MISSTISEALHRSSYTFRCFVRNFLPLETFLENRMRQNRLGGTANCRECTFPRKVKTHVAARSLGRAYEQDRPAIEGARCWKHKDSLKGLKKGKRPSKGPRKEKSKMKIGISINRSLKKLFTFTMEMEPLRLENRTYRK